MRSGAHRECRRGRAWTLRQLKISAPEQASGIWERCCRPATSPLGSLPPGLHVLDGPFSSGRPAGGALKRGGVALCHEGGQERPADFIRVDERLADRREIALRIG